MNITKIEQNLKDLIDSFDKDEFIYDLLLAYGKPESSIKRLRGNLNLSNVEGEVSWKRHLLFKEERNADLHLTITELVKSIKNDQRFVIVTDYVTLLAVDIKTLDKLDIKLTDLPKHYDFFLPWAGMEKTQHQDENPADVKAAEKMAKLFDKIKEDNPDDSPEFLHGLNVFLSRLLFCFFAEDTNIFTENQFTSNISSHTQSDGSDLHSYLASLFKVLNTPESDRQGLPDYLKEFPYVNGELFSKEHQMPVFKAKSRKAIIDSGKLDWSSINPDIFGSMFQAVVGETERGSLGMHYTSVPNIMKVIKPLFLDDLHEEFEKSIGNNKKLIKLADRLSKIKIFDPACGSGNFLIIAFKKLKYLEMEILKALNSFGFSRITPSQFYGIDIEDFNCELAKISLWLSEHQMNIKFFNEFNRVKPTLPLKKAGNITCANATRVEWEKVCPKEEDDEIYILGNPPYLGSKNQDDEQKVDMGLNFKNNYKTLDYISCWFYKGSRYIKGSNASFAFVSTNSICQGEQVSLLWRQILSDHIEIKFAYQPFKWKNNARNNAGVTVVIIGCANKCKYQKYLFNEKTKKSVKNINPYLVEGSTIYIDRKGKPFKNYPRMVGGNVSYDSGHLIFTEAEMNDFISKEPNSKKWFRKLMGGKELLNGGIRYCLWFKDVESASDLKDMPLVVDRIEKVKQARLGAKDKGTHKLAKRSHQFRDLKNPGKYIAIPKTSSENRKYVPMRHLDGSWIPSDSIRLIENAEPFHFGILNSSMHMVWIKAVSGKLEMRLRYSKDISYNTFPFPTISEKQKEVLNQRVRNILDEREKHPEKTLAQLYDPDKMPDGLREAHHQNDLAIERCYRSKPFESDEERLEYLFKLYEKMIAKEETK
jgi:hypothetical protein